MVLLRFKFLLIFGSWISRFQEDSILFLLFEISLVVDDARVAVVPWFYFIKDHPDVMLDSCCYLF
jgi:hypothetical protein